MALPAVISLVTLGVRDVGASTRFYVQLGFPLSSASVPGEVSFFRTAGSALALYGRDALAADAGQEPQADANPGSASLAINVASRDAVDAALADAAAAAATVVREAQPTDWGGYNGYFADLDGHLWEVAHNPGWPLDAAGLPRLPE